MNNSATQKYSQQLGGQSIFDKVFNAGKPAETDSKTKSFAEKNHNQLAEQNKKMLGLANPSNLLGQKSASASGKKKAAAPAKAGNGESQGPASSAANRTAQATAKAFFS
jgi:hypothetical protein